ncbi:hypothetical protein PV396_42605 [Streptomyces sp. ME02-8801-2C]|uniref:hypothetical protein n=1 Tax=Streptomyces sp. ME02-8801-2C TaxID=3028680 RepID=UPI0029AE2D62|nr:hypothetical protein [Streptomyces sp. ME02-8801-2C]MDX3458555.1 hypothetical protein [Streptomyces sp. ME02-8801-2C]
MTKALMAWIQVTGPLNYDRKNKQAGSVIATDPLLNDPAAGSFPEHRHGAVVRLEVC